MKLNLSEYYQTPGSCTLNCSLQGTNEAWECFKDSWEKSSAGHSAKHKVWTLALFLENTSSSSQGIPDSVLRDLPDHRLGHPVLPDRPAHLRHPRQLLDWAQQVPQVQGDPLHAGRLCWLPPLVLHLLHLLHLHILHLLFLLHLLHLHLLHLHLLHLHLLHLLHLHILLLLLLLHLLHLHLLHLLHLHILHLLLLLHLLHLHLLHLDLLHLLHLHILHLIHLHLYFHTSTKLDIMAILAILVRHWVNPSKRGGMDGVFRGLTGLLQGEI